MTQQNQPTLLEQARLTDAECLAIRLAHMRSEENHAPARPVIDAAIVNAATRKAFEVIIARAREIGNSDVRGFADALEAQIRSEEAHDA